MLRTLDARLSWRYDADASVEATFKMSTPPPQPLSGGRLCYPAYVAFRILLKLRLNSSIKMAQSALSFHTATPRFQ